MDKWARLTFLIALSAALLLFVYTLSDYLLPVLIGAMLVVLAQPMGNRMRARMPRRPRLAALLSTLTAFLLLVVPLSVFLTFVVREIVVFVGRAQEFLAQGGGATLTAHAKSLLAWLPDRVTGSLPEPGQVIDRSIGALGRWAGGQITALATTAGSVAIAAFLTFVSTYYLFLDGDKLVARLDRVLPLNRRYERELFKEFRDTIVAVFYGTGIVGVVQGALIWLALTITGVPEAAVWGGLAIVTAFIPMLGSGLVWAPVGVVMLVAGETWQGLFILIFGAVVISSADNILRPLLVKGRVRVHSLIVFLSIFGGLATFGAIGVVLGPVVASLTMALLRIWERDFIGPKLKSETHPLRPPGGLEALDRLPPSPPPPRRVERPGMPGSDLR